MTLLRIRLAVVFVLSVVLHCDLAIAEDEASFPGKQSDWHGFTRYDFEVDGRQWEGRGFGMESSSATSRTPTSPSSVAAFTLST